MATDKKIAAELAALRAEFEALKAQQTSQASGSALSLGGDGEATKHTGGGFMDTAAHVPEQFREFETAIRDLAEAVETDIAEHPVAAVGAAFLLGILIGRLSSR